MILKHLVQLAPLLSGGAGIWQWFADIASCLKKTTPVSKDGITHQNALNYPKSLTVKVMTYTVYLHTLWHLILKGICYALRSFYITL